MEILELLFASGEACGCFVQVLAALIDIGAGMQGYQVGKKIKARRQAQAHGDPVPNKPLLWPFLLLAFFAVCLTGLAVASLVMRPR